MNTWIITDTHFNHKKLVEYEQRPENFTELIIRNWKKRVKPEDTIIHLGDVILGKDGTLKDILLSLPGKKILTRGNHDHKSNLWYMSHGFDFSCEYFLMMDVLFSHIPTTPLPLNARINIHGHFHRSEHRAADFQDNVYYQNNRSQYKLVHIEGHLSPILLSDILRTSAGL